MVVCECLALTDRQVRQKLEGGACRLSDLVPKAALEVSCGSCFHALKKMIREHQEKSLDAQPSSPQPSFPSLSV